MLPTSPSARSRPLLSGPTPLRARAPAAGRPSPPVCGPPPPPRPLGHVPGLRVRVDPGLGQDLLRRRAPHAEDVGEPDLDPLLARQVYACYPCHLIPASACAGDLGRSPSPHPGGV